MQGFMLALARWTRSSITVTIAGSAETWTPAVALATVAETAAALGAWILDGARAWAASVTACTAALVEVGDGLGVAVMVTAGGAPAAVATSAPTGRWATYLPALDGTVACLGTFALPVNTYGWSRHDKGPGGITGGGDAWQNGATRYAPRRPALSVVLEPAQAARLELATRYTPQLGTYLQVYDPHTAAWRTLTYGALTVEGTSDLHTVTFEAIGGPTS